MKKIAIVTGASRGIGREIAKTFAVNGMQVIANYNKSEEKAKELQEELRRQGIDIDIFKADVSKREEARKLVEFAIGKYKRINILVNNAGISQIKLFTELTEDDINNMINVNLKSVIYMSQEVAKNMIHNKSGQIINISSVWGIVGASCEVHYSMTKAGINGFTKALAKELGPSNIKVNAVAPGYIDTDMNLEVTESEREELIEEIPLKKVGTTEDIARCVYMLTQNEYITGEIIKVDGGWMI